MKLSLRLALSLAVAVGLLSVLMALGGVAPSDLLAGLKRLSFETYACALGLHAALYVLRALRFRVLLPAGRRPAFGRLLSITASYTMAALILPAKLGEASFVVYADRAAGVPAAEGVACLLVSRLLDFATLALGMSVACLVLWGTHAYPQLPWLGPLGAALFPVSLILFGASARGDLLVRATAHVSRHLGLARSGPGAKLLAGGERLATALRAAGTKGRLLGAALLSLPAWGCVFLFCAVLARGLGLPPETSLAQATFGSGLAILTSLLPVSAFANFGTLEAGWVLGFHALGVSTDLAYSTGVGLHLVQLANAVLLGLLGHVGMALAAERPQA